MESALLTRSRTELEDPHLTIRWGIRPEELRGFSGSRLKRAGCGSSPKATSCSPAEHSMDSRLTWVSHFRPRSEKGRLAELEFFDNGQKELKASYDLYQQHLERVFGRPWCSRAGSSLRNCRRTSGGREGCTCRTTLWNGSDRRSMSG